MSPTDQTAQEMPSLAILIPLYPSLCVLFSSLLMIYLCRRSIRHAYSRLSRTCLRKNENKNYTRLGDRNEVELESGFESDIELDTRSEDAEEEEEENTDTDTDTEEASPTQVIHHPQNPSIHQHPTNQPNHTDPTPTQEPVPVPEPEPEYPPLYVSTSTPKPPSSTHTCYPRQPRQRPAGNGDFGDESTRGAGWAHGRIGWPRGRRDGCFRFQLDCRIKYGHLEGGNRSGVNVKTDELINR